MTAQRWAAGVLTAAGLGIFISQQGSEPERDVVTLSAPSAASQPSSVWPAQEFKKAAPPESASSPTPSPAEVERANDIKFAKHFYKKFLEAPLGERKFSFLRSAYASLSGRLRDAPELGLQPEQLAGLLRTHAVHAINDLKTQQPSNNIERFFQAKRMDIALQFVGMKADGYNDLNYVDQMGLGITLEETEKSMIALSQAAAQDAAKQLFARKDNLDLSALSDDQIIHLGNLREALTYFVEDNAVGDSMPDHLWQKDKRYGLIKVDPVEWDDFRTKLNKAIVAEQQRRVDQEFSAPAAPLLEKRAP